MSAAEEWRAQLEAWAIPGELLAAVPDSPYQWPAQLWKRRRASDAASGEERPTARVVRGLLPQQGTLLDVGAGTGRASLPLAREGYRLTAVERNPGMAQGFRDEARALGVEARLVMGSWPEVAKQVEPHDVVLCAHVVYDVQDIGPFLRALHDRARRGVVLELTPNHPWADLAPYYRSLHGLARPEGPTAEELAEVVREVCGLLPQRERWRRPGGLWFGDRDELLVFFRRRLVLPEERGEELEGLLAPEIVERDGQFFLGEEAREMVTMWWETRGDIA
ncbi:MAG: class I SAM-dependent methyltransferase [Actinomycetota bacterium]|nr:class I SAM-dependent methyltransferase [Actinomycetota bacterium]